MSAMDSANLAASWVSALVTTIGLGSLITQAASFQNQLDPFHKTRGKEHLGVWIKIQENPGRFALTKQSPKGPMIEANLHGCLGEKVIHLSRKPICELPVGTATWTVLLAVFHPFPVKVRSWHGQVDVPVGSEKVVSETIKTSNTSTLEPLSEAGYEAGPDLPIPWQRRKGLRTRALIQYHSAACTTMSKVTLITFLLLSQAREVYRCTGAAGVRIAWAGYNGIYRVEWPLGHKPILRFEAHESHPRGQDCYPETFPRRPQRCVEMCCGVIEINSMHVKVAFAGRKSPGAWILKYLPKRFGAQKSAADLFNTIGGQAHEVDYLSRRQPMEDEEPELSYALKLSVPSLKDNEMATLYLEEKEAHIVAACLDHLPWSPVAWSIHRGMKDILVAYGRSTLKAYRGALADALRDAITQKSWILVAQGWQSDFVHKYMADQAVSAILGEDTCSGDACRIVSAAALLLWNKVNVALDRTHFWTHPVGVRRESFDGKPAVEKEDLTPDAIIALIKFLFVMWSHEFDYEMGWHLPSQLYVV